MRKVEREILYKIALNDENGSKYVSRIKSRVLNFPSTLLTYNGQLEVVYDRCCSNKAEFKSLAQLKEIVAVCTEKPLLDYLKKHPCKEGK